MAQKISFNINTKELNNIVSLCNQLSPKRSEIELFTFTKIEIANSSVKFSATNGTVFYSNSLKIAGEIESSISFLIKTEALHNIINLMNDENVDISVDLDRLTLIISGGSKSKNQLRITQEGLSDYILPSSNPDRIKTRLLAKANDILEANKSAFISVGTIKNLFQTEFHNICYTVIPESNTLLIVSTDRFRITKNTVEVEYLYIDDNLKATPTTNFLISPTSLKLLAGSVDTKQENLEIVLEDETVYFVFGTSAIISSRYGAGVYADYERIIPQSFACSMDLNTAEFSTALRQVLWCVRNDISKSVNLAINTTEKSITFSTKNSDGDLAEYQVIIDQYEGTEENWNQSFNAEFLLDYLGLIKTETFKWESNPGKPAVLSPKDLKAKQFYLCSSLK